MKAAITEAQRAGKKTATHAHGKAGIKTAVLAGIDSVEHGSYLDDECIELMLERGTALCPTLATHYFSEKFGVEAGIAPWKIEKGKVSPVMEKLKIQFFVNTTSRNVTQNQSS